MRPKLPYFAAIAPQIAGRTSARSLTPAAPLFRAGPADIEIVDVHQQMPVSPRRSARLATFHESALPQTLAAQPPAADPSHPRAALAPRGEIPGRGHAAAAPARPPARQAQAGAMPVAPSPSPGQGPMKNATPRRAAQTDTGAATAMATGAATPQQIGAMTLLESQPPRLLPPQPPVFRPAGIPQPPPPASVHIGTLEVRIVAPPPAVAAPPPPARLAASRQRATRPLARGFGVFGLGQS